MKRTLSIILAVATSISLALAATVSPPIQSSQSAGGNSFNPVFSADGQHLAWVSPANNLVPNDDLGLWLDVFVRDLVTSNTVLVSVSTNGAGGANWDANYPSLSSNGQFVAFASRASNLVPGDTNDAEDIFVRDVLAGATRLVSVDVNGNSLIDPNPASSIPLCGNPMISGDGRWVFFESRATNLIAANVPAGSVNVYARDLLLNVTELVSMDVSGLPLGGLASLGSISLDARYAAFTTTNQNVIVGQANSGPDVYVRDRQAGVTRWASTNATVAFSGGSYACGNPVLAPSGQGVAFLATGSSSSLPMFFDLLTGVRTTVVSSSLSNSPPIVNADASFLAFESGAGGFTSILIWNRASGTTSNVHQKLLGNYPDKRTMVDALSDDGRYVIYREFGSDSPYFTNTFLPRYNVFRKDLQTATIALVSMATNNGASSSSFEFAAVAARGDASRIAFDSAASDLAPGDLNGLSDIFMRDPGTGRTELVSKAILAKPNTTSFAHSFLGPNSISGDGRYIVSLRYDDPSAYRDTNGLQDVYLTDASNGLSIAASINNTYFTYSDGGVVGTNATLAENTNAFISPIISADGSMVVAMRGYVLGPTRIYGNTVSNILNGGGLFLISRGININTSENGSSYGPSISSNGSLIVFTSTSSDLAAGVNDGNFAPDIYLHTSIPLSNGLFSSINILISAALSGHAGNNGSSNGIISPDGTWVVFESAATDLVADGLGGGLFVRNLLSSTTYRVNVAAGNYSFASFAPSAGSARWAADSRHLAFGTSSSLIVMHDLTAHTNVVVVNVCCQPSNPSPNYNGSKVLYGNANLDLYPPTFDFRLYDFQTAQRTIVAGGFSSPPGAAELSSDARFVIYQTTAYLNSYIGTNYIVVHDLLLGSTVNIGAGNGPSTRPTLAADGRTVVFQSFASDLVAGDYNDKRDLFVLKLGGVDSDGDGLDDDWEIAYFGNLSRDGSGDFDGDGVSDRDEFLAGTDPTNANSVFRVLTVTPVGGGARTLVWSGNPTRSYQAEFKDDLGASGWTALTGTISWNGSTASILDSSATNSATRYYRVVRVP